MSGTVSIVYEVSARIPVFPDVSCYLLPDLLLDSEQCGCDGQLGFAPHRGRDILGISVPDIGP